VTPAVALAPDMPLALPTTPRPGGPKGVAGAGSVELDPCAARASARTGRSRSTAGVCAVAAVVVAGAADHGEGRPSEGACAEGRSGADDCVDLA
jgi:hypothetical protein